MQKAQKLLVVRARWIQPKLWGLLLLCQPVQFFLQVLALSLQCLMLWRGDISAILALLDRLVGGSSRSGRLFFVHSQASGGLDSKALQANTNSTHGLGEAFRLRYARRFSMTAGSTEGVGRPYAVEHLQYFFGRSWHQGGLDLCFCVPWRRDTDTAIRAASLVCCR